MTHTFGDDFISLNQKSCIPCRGGVPPLTKSEIAPLIQQIHSDWSLIEEHHIERNVKFDNFVQALKFVNDAGAICEKEGHHADFELSWGLVKIKIWTHKIDGLTESDFILASKIDDIEG